MHVQNKMFVSVVIPSFNHSKYISRCIKSVLNQTYQEFELIIIDDGSVDSSVDIISRFGDRRITLVQQENSGAHNAINRGISLSSGDVIAILNSDDEFSSRWLEIGCRELSKSDLVCSWLHLINENSNVNGIKHAWNDCLPWELGEYPSNLLDKLGTFNFNLLRSNFVATTSNMIFKRDVFNTIGGFAELRYAHDWDFLLRVCLHDFRCSVYPEALVNYRSHNSNTISSHMDDMNLDIAIILEVYIRLFYSKNFKNISGLESIRSLSEFRNNFYFPPVTPSLGYQLSLLIDYYVQKLKSYSELPTIISNIQMFLSRQTILKTNASSS